MRQHRQHGQRSVAELVSRYQIACAPVRDLIVRYLSERAPALDYSTLRWLTYRLTVLFWGDLERHHPGIDSLRLPPDLAQSWKWRLAHKPDGSPRAQYLDILVSVRSFYLDMAQWALADPAAWGTWAAPCPVSEADLAAYPKAMRRRTARMQQRTRTLAPVLPSLVEAASRRLAHAERLLAAAANAEPGSAFTVDDTGYRRLAPRRPNEHRCLRVIVLDAGDRPVVDGPRLTPARQEEEAFWAWAVVEVLRQSGARIEEVLELTHLSLRRYVQPSGELVPLLQVSPSKTDTERVLPIAPELVAVLARIIRRIKAGGEVVPVVSRYDPLEQAASAPLPYLFQRRWGHRPTVLTGGYVRALLDRLVDYAGLRDVDGAPLRFVPHDFRRIIPA
ncbi:MAG: tyrosine-type recombinase/integrase, partial [Acidimicrobiales bacterium]